MTTMRSLHHLCVIVIIFATCNLLAQEADSTKRPISKIENFLSKTGAIFEKSYNKIGEVGCKGAEQLTIQTVAVKDSRSGQTISGVLFEIQKIEKYSISREAAYIDNENLSDFINALELILTKSQELSKQTIEYKEIFFETINEVKIGFYQKGLEQTGFLFLNRWQSDARTYFGLNRIPEIIGLLKTAKTKLSTS